MSKPVQNEVKKNSNLFTYIKMVMKSGGSVKHLLRNGAISISAKLARHCPRLAGVIIIIDFMMTPH